MVQQDPNFPADKLPQCWSDDIRMNALFAPFRLKSSNPESWEMKMKFWSDMIKQWCRHRRDPIVSAADIKFAFQRKGRTPACIDIVVEEMFRNGELAHVSKYPQILHNGPEGWLRWGVRLAFKPAALAVTAVTTLLPSKQLLDSDGLPKASIDSTQRFVVESVVKEQATELIQNYPPGEDRLGTIEELMKKCNWQQSRETFEVLLSYLVLNGAAVKKDDVVKLAEPNKKASPITEADETLVRLMCAEERLESDAIRLSKEVSAAESDAKAALTLGNRVHAKSHLRRKHRAVQRLSRCETALENVRQLLHQAKEVSSNVDILDTYKTSSQAMKSTMKSAGLTEDNVLDTMDELKEVMDTYNEVEKALSTTTDDYDQLELEDELKELLAGPGGPSGGTPQKEESRERDRRSEVPNLPSPPTAIPKPRKASEREFIFDGEARMIAELNDLSDHDMSLRGAGTSKKPKDPASQPWYPKSSKNVWGDNDLDSSVDKIADGFAEIMQDERLHPGQPLDLNFASPPRLYNTEFKVRDHKPSDGVEIYNSKENDSFTHSTEYFSVISPGKLGGTFQMAPGGERKKSIQIDSTDDEDEAVEDLERRLKDLRGLKS